MVSHFVFYAKPCYNKYNTVRPFLYEAITVTDLERKSSMLILILFFLWSLIGFLAGFVLRVIFHILPVKTIIAVCLICYGLHMLGISFS